MEPTWKLARENCKKLLCELIVSKADGIFPQAKGIVLPNLSVKT
uniref:Uncharacterized protein n=1 Tax=Nelumbo nucifera TaxID=4432 RepID=A0A822YS95_NELNU|nr:TPA_asm: hypothetical protein HUJ06_005624 [Nelumbo nucifera]